MKQISHKLIMRNINELIGIINGISYDGIINKLEVARLSSWVKKNRNLSYEHKQAHLISLVEQVLEDGIITDEEREMLLENCSQYTAFETDSIAKVYELNGIIEGIICDNEINEKEVCRLQDWMRTNESFIRYHKPSKTICEKIDQILEDGIVTQEEQKSLLEMLKKRLNDAQIETKIGYLKNCVKERKNLGIDLIDLLDNADAIDIIHSRAESQLGSTLNSYSGTYVRDPEIVFVSLVLIGMLYYDGAFYESVRKTYKSLYQRYSEQKVEGLIRTLLNNYRTKDDATGTKTRIINVVLAGSIVPSYYLGSFFEFIYDIYKLNFDSNLPDDLYGEFQFVYDGLQNVMRSESINDELLVMNKSSFNMCPICGYSDIVKGKVITPTSLKKHKNYRQFDCSCEELTQVRLGHRFQTDVARFTIPMLGSFTKEDYAIALSFMYAFLEGISIGLGIERNDIDGVLELNLEQHSYDILIYDNVPGGAGHVKRLVEKNAVITSLNTAYVKVSQQCCDENTSCYNCLRNYYNQTNHSKLKRKYARDFIESLLRQIGVRP